MRTWLLVVMLALLPAASNAQPAPSPPAQPGTHDGHGGHSAPVVPTRPSGDAQDVRPEREDAPLPPFIPVLTDADREAAFPRLRGHAVHDQSINTFVLFDQLEWQMGGGDGLWLCGGYTGHGMPVAPLSARAVVGMMGGKPLEDVDLPAEFYSACPQRWMKM